MLGRLKILIDSETSKIVSSRERLWDPVFKQTVNAMAADISYAKTARYTNTLLGREAEKIVARTLEDNVRSDGKHIEELYKENRKSILTEYGFDPATGLLMDSSKLPENVVRPNPAHSDDELAEFADEIGRLVETYNNKHDVEIKMSSSEIIATIEHIPDDAVIVCIDEVGVKHQKEYRKDENRIKAQKTMTPEEIKLENAENVETAVAYIRCTEGIYRIAEKTITLALLTTLAFLLSNNLMADKKLLFFTDGARNLKCAIESIFSFRPFTINLDWIHVKRYCYQLLTMALIGGKDNHERNENIRNEFFNYIWVGDIQGGKDYLDTIDPSFVKNPSMIQSVKNYLDRKSNDEGQKYFYCYAMRKEMGLINSSNQGEKSNDMLVAQRQKHNGMSWVVEGSAALGHIRQIEVNGEAECFYKTGTMPFKPIKLSENIAEKYKYKSNVA